MRRDPEGEQATDKTARADVMPKLAPDFSRAVYCVLGLPVDAVTPAQAIERIAASIREGRRCYLSTPNMNFVTTSRIDLQFWDSVLRSDLSIADGMPLVWVSRILGLPIQRVAGSSLFASLMEGAAGPLTVFFFGGSEGIARAACERINRLGGSMRCSGYHLPGFGSVDEMSSLSILKTINDAGADFFGASIGSKKGPLWIARNEWSLASPAVWYSGAAVNFVAGTVKRAPEVLSRLGFEWLWRIKEEPSLWRRYFADLKTLLRLFTFRVIPCAVYQIINRPSDADLTRARLEVFRGDILYTLRFSGPWTESNLNPARDAFRRAAEGVSDLVLDLENITYADAAFLGLIMIAYGYQARTGRGFSIRSISKSGRTVLYLHACEFLITTHCERENARPSEGLPDGTFSAAG
jgi:N-acetylglucosaminyldiphosphoundecaprenol N-acetyl-beta-D-mannosaminyltransferase